MEIKPMTKAILMLTDSCNLACPYCYEKSSINNLSLKDAKLSLDFLHNNARENDIVRIILFGGEPMLRFNETIIPLIEYNKEKKYKTYWQMTTNGTLFNKENLIFLKDNNIRYMLSFDGIDQSINRPMKNGLDSYNNIISIWDEILKNLVNTTIRSTINKKNIPNLFKNILLMVELGVKSYHILPNFWDIWDEKDIKLLNLQFILYEDYIIKSFKDNKIPLLFFDYNYSFWKIAMSSEIKERRNIALCDPQNRCGMGVKGSNSIDIHGDIYGCHHISPLVRESEWYLGNIYDGIDNKRVENLIKLYNKKILGNEDCKTCPLDNVCDGGCTATNLMVTGDLNKVPKVYCYWKRAVSDSAYRVILILGKEENKLFKEYFIERCKYGR